MVKLEDIGFYTLSNNRAKNLSIKSPMWRCEMILTDSCNFRCPYCRGLSKEQKGFIEFTSAMETLRMWCDDGLQNIRFSGGEPLLYPKLEELVTYCKSRNVKHIAISSNGSFPIEKYESLIKCGVNDFSISLDSCCSSGCDLMSGRENQFETICNNIKKISSMTYTTVGIVVTKETAEQLVETIKFASSLGVADIRIISAAQWNDILEQAKNIPLDIMNKHPILKYRIRNIISNRNVRGITEQDCRRCYLVLDDSVVVKGEHYPCVIYMREGGKPIGKIGSNMREERLEWFKAHDTHNDIICKNNCLDVCIDHNNTCNAFRMANLDREDLLIEVIKPRIGGQHVWPVNQSIKVLHIPSGIEVICEENRSQHQNRARAIKIIEELLTLKEIIKDLKKQYPEIEEQDLLDEKF